MICLLSNFRDRQTGIVAYRGAISNQKGSPRVHWKIGRLHAKNQGPKARDKRYTPFLGNYDRPTNRPTYQLTDEHEGL